MQPERDRKEKGRAGTPGWRHPRGLSSEMPYVWPKIERHFLGEIRNFMASDLVTKLTLALR